MGNEHITRFLVSVLAYFAEKGANVYCGMPVLFMALF
jgi:hypothetical protein